MLWILQSSRLTCVANQLTTYRTAQNVMNWFDHVVRQKGQTAKESALTSPLEFASNNSIHRSASNSILTLCIWVRITVIFN